MCQPLDVISREAERPDNPMAWVARSEILRRTAEAQINTAIAQMDAGKWMKISVLILSIAACMAALFQGLAWLWPNPLNLH
jgi:hypothetical protein